MINKTILIMLNLDKLLQEKDTYVKLDRVIKEFGTESECVGLITVWLVSLDIHNTLEHRSIHVINDRKRK